MLFSCSDTEQENLLAGKELSEVGDKAVLTLTLRMPEVGTASRAVAQPETENSRAEECKISDALVILGKMADGLNAPTMIDQKFYVNNFEYDGNQSQWTTSILCNPGYYRILVIANPGKLIRLEDITSSSWHTLANRILSFEDFNRLKTIWDDNYFLMTNAYQGTTEDFDVHLILGEHANKVIAVQRACARFDYQVKQADNIYPLPCVVDGRPATLNIQLQEVALMNVSKSFNLFKQIVADNRLGTIPDFYQTEKADNYVYDSDWDAKRIFALNLIEANHLNEYFFYPSEQGRNNIPTEQGQDIVPLVHLSYQPLPHEVTHTDVRLMYCSENTIPGIKAQVNKLSTGLVFKGYFGKPKEVDKIPDEFYSRIVGGKTLIYTSLESLKKALQDEGIPLPKTMTENHLANLHISKFTPDKKTGKCSVWYTYWNRHRDNHDNQLMGIMEFAVVRNNLYKLSINSIKSLGLPQPPNMPENPWKPAGETPDEVIPQLDITVKVCDWLNRELNHHI
ncbi:hypothetical protein EVA_17097 [gut metagenome]|uniref:Minor fimbrium subunit Mfa1 C-terminal domain-containing protein n=1 Tax=gut metagenome TaxID=749906 RepID=J9FK44_9ZZZZ